MSRFAFVMEDLGDTQLGGEAYERQERRRFRAATADLLVSAQGEDQFGEAIRGRLAQVLDELLVVQPTEAFLGQRRPSVVPHQALEPGAVPVWDLLLVVFKGLRMVVAGLLLICWAVYGLGSTAFLAGRFESRAKRVILELLT